MLQLVIALGACMSTATPELSDPKARAQELIASGNEFYAKKEYQGALGLFERAYAVYPSPIIFYNIARANGALGNWIRAAEYYEKFLAESGGKPGTERYELATAALRELDGRLGHLSITGAPPDAETKIDGQRIDPYAESIRVLAGDHEITSTLAEHDPFRTTVSVAAGASVSVEIALVRAIERPVAAVAFTPPIETAGPAEESVTGAWWFWALVIGGVALAAGATAVVASGSEFSRTGELGHSSTNAWESF